jgi:TPR repeat protein
MDKVGAFASNNMSILQSENGRKMQSTMRTYSKIASLVDREVMSWNSLPLEQQSQMDEVIKDLNYLATSSGSDEIATESQFILGVIYENGRGMDRPKYDRAAELYQSSAEGGCKEALSNLAGLTRSGAEGVKKDLVLAFCIYETAAQLEHVNAAYNLAVMYANGEGVAKDSHSAEQWFLFASARGHKGAQKNLEIIDRQRNIQLAFVMLATLVLGMLLTWFLTTYGGNLYHTLFEEPDTSTQTTNPGAFSMI